MTVQRTDMTGDNQGWIEVSKADEAFEVPSEWKGSLGWEFVRPRPLSLCISDCYHSLQAPVYEFGCF